ncbi:MAG: HlyD family efflux transporter periplasmic adaptor subunit [Cyclobacteriaceae bacterium]|nr:HlyD family efflux transporter periplasmic adaptor subunit [Cyclobacteriaceae bacterium]
MMKSKLFYLFILAAAATLIIVSLTAVNRSNAIMAVVESQKMALSYHKPVTIEAIHVSAGQKITKGQLLLEVDRPDLNLDTEKMLTRKNKVLVNKSLIKSSYETKLELLKIELNGKTTRLNAEIGRLESEIATKNTIHQKIKSLAGDSANSTDPGFSDPDSILLQSYILERNQVALHYQTEKRRLESVFNEEIRVAELELSLIDQEMAELKVEAGELKKYAPFNGTIGSVNAQLQEIVPPYETILSIYEERPTTIKAYISNNSEFQLTVGNDILIESSTRKYETHGTVIEIGARIVSYQNPGSVPGLPDLYGREVFIQLPPENEFLYGEQVYVYPKVK